MKIGNRSLGTTKCTIDPGQARACVAGLGRVAALLGMALMSASASASANPGALDRSFGVGGG